VTVNKWTFIHTHTLHMTPFRKYLYVTYEVSILISSYNHLHLYSGADKSLARSGRKQATATE